MTARKSVKGCGNIVGVITNVAELHRSIRMRNPPDLFEVRLDHFVHFADELEINISMLRKPVIITARHPREGGVNKLSIKQRRNLLHRFLPHASYIDIELRSVGALRSVVDDAGRAKVKCIISFHDFGSMPAVRSLHTKALAAKRCGADIFKIAVRTDTSSQLSRLVDFAKTADVDLPMSVMGIGKLGVTSRLALASHSVLNYAAIGRPVVKGQLSVRQLRTKVTRRF